MAFPPHGPKDRFKVVKIVTSMPLRRGRWSVVDYPDKDKDKSVSKDLGQTPQQQLTSASVPASIVPQQPPPGTHLVLFFQKRARKICNKSSNCAYMCLTITKITMVSLSKFNSERPFIVIFVIVKHNWNICCGILIVYGLVFSEFETPCKTQT